MKQPLNLARISLTSFLAYFVMSAIITPLGIVSQPLAEYFSVSITTATAVFSYLTTGILVGSIVAIFVFDYLSVKRVVLLSAAMIALALTAISWLDSFSGLSICLFLAGLGCGIALSTAAAVITHAWSEKLRPSMLLLTDSFYSGAGTISTLLAVYFLARQYQWWSAYWLALGTLMVLLLLAVMSRYPEPVKATGQMPADRIGEWPLTVHLCGLALLLYLMGLVVIYSWVPNYAQAALGMDAASAGGLVGKMFSGMFFGQLVMFVLVLRLPVRGLLTGCVLLATLMTASLWLDSTPLPIDIAMPLLGFVGGGILKVAISHGTTLTMNPSPKLVSYLLFGTALGTAIAPALSAWIVSMSNYAGALMFATLCYVLCSGLLIYSFMVAPSVSRAVPPTVPSAVPSAVSSAVSSDTEPSS